MVHRLTTLRKSLRCSSGHEEAEDWTPEAEHNPAADGLTPARQIRPQPAKAQSGAFRLGDKKQAPSNEAHQWSGGPIAPPVQPRGPDTQDKPTKDL